MNDLAIVKTHELFISLIDGIPTDMLPDELKQRDKREPGRKQKLAYELAYARVVYRHFRRQKNKIRQWLEFNYPFRKSEKFPFPDDWWEDDEAMADFLKLDMRMYLHAIQLVEDGVLIGIDYSIFNALAADYARAHAGELIKNIDSTTLESVRSAISSFVETPGMTIGDTMDMLPFDQKRAWRVATTEITNVYSRATLEAGAELKNEYPDVRVTKTWFTNVDDRTCELCGPLNGMEIDINDQFPGGFDAPAAHVNCRCWMQTRTRI